jgi:hypothetical protein
MCSNDGLKHLIFWNGGSTMQPIIISGEKNKEKRLNEYVHTTVGMRLFSAYFSDLKFTKSIQMPYISIVAVSKCLD